MVPEVYWYKIDPIWTPLWGYMGAQSFKKWQICKKGAHFCETILGEKDSKSIVFSYSESSFCQYFLVTEKTEKILQILILEILKF